MKTLLKIVILSAALITSLFLGILIGEMIPDETAGFLTDVITEIVTLAAFFIIVIAIEAKHTEKADIVRYEAKRTTGHLLGDASGRDAGKALIPLKNSTAS